MDDVAIRRLDALDCRVEPLPWAWAAANRARIDAHWSSIARPGLFNGQVLLMHRWAVEDGVLRSAHGLTDYAAFLAWRDFGFPDPSVRNCFAMAALVSADGAYLLGEMGPQTANAGRIYFPAGTPDPSDIAGDRLDLEGSVLRELAEETGIEPHEVGCHKAEPCEAETCEAEPCEAASGAGWTMLEAGPRTALMREVRSAMPADALVARVAAFLAREAEPELARLHAVRSPADVDRLADRMPDFQRAYLREAFQRTG